MAIIPFMQAEDIIKQHTPSQPAAVRRDFTDPASSSNMPSLRSPVPRHELHAAAAMTPHHPAATVSERGALHEPHARQMHSQPAGRSHVKQSVARSGGTGSPLVRRCLMTSLNAAGSNKEPGHGPASRLGALHIAASGGNAHRQAWHQAEAEPIGRQLMQLPKPLDHCRPLAGGSAAAQVRGTSRHVPDAASQRTRAVLTF